MRQEIPQCQSLADELDVLFALLEDEPSLRNRTDTVAVRTALRKIMDPRFEIVFAGAFSAGKSMLINALLGRELLYSAEGHATGTECYIAHPDAGQVEQVVLTFLSGAEVQEQAIVLAQRLGLQTEFRLSSPEGMTLLKDWCHKIVKEEGGESKSERAKQANALSLLLEGYERNRDHIQDDRNAV